MILQEKYANNKSYFTTNYRGYKIVLSQLNDRWFYVIYNADGIFYNSLTENKTFTLWKVGLNEAYHKLKVMLNKPTRKVKKTNYSLKII